MKINKVGNSILQEFTLNEVAEIINKKKQIELICGNCNKKVPLNEVHFMSMPVNLNIEEEEGEETHNPLCAKCYAELFGEKIE